MGQPELYSLAPMASMSRLVGRSRNALTQDSSQLGINRIYREQAFKTGPRRLSKRADTVRIGGCKSDCIRESMWVPRCDVPSRFSMPNDLGDPTV